MALTGVKRFFSGSTDGLAINLTATTGGSTPIHTGSTSTAVFDEVYIFASHSATAMLTLLIEWGQSARTIKEEIPPRSGMYPVVMGLPLWGRSAAGTVISAYGSTSQVIDIYGYNIRVTET